MRADFVCRSRKTRPPIGGKKGVMSFQADFLETDYSICSCFFFFFISMIITTITTMGTIQIRRWTHATNLCVMTQAITSATMSTPAFHHGNSAWRSLNFLDSHSEPTTVTASIRRKTRVIIPVNIARSSILSDARQVQSTCHASPALDSYSVLPGYEAGLVSSLFTSALRASSSASVWVTAPPLI